MSYQKQITHIEGLVALGVAAERAGGKLTESHNGFHRNIIVGEACIKVDLRKWDGACPENQPLAGIEAAFFDLGWIRQGGYRDSRKFSKRVAVNSKGVLDVAKLVIAIEKCVAAQAAHKVLDTARKERAALERNLQEQAEEKLAASRHFRRDEDWSHLRCDAPDVLGFMLGPDGQVQLKLHRVSPERAIEILDAISKTAPTAS